MSREKRILLASSPECREQDGRKLFVGNAVVYGKRSEPIYGMFREQFAPGAFREHLATNPDVVATVDHDYGKLLGRTSSGTVKLSDTDTALGVEVSRGNTTAANDLADMLNRKDIRGMSFIFDMVDDEWAYDEAAKCRIRTVRAARLFEVSFVTFPCYPDTDADMRSVRSIVSQHSDTYDMDLRRRMLDLEKIS